jgi:hypothetical protein
VILELHSQKQLKLYSKRTRKMTTETRAAHSPLGASGAERWMNCPGSVALLKRMDLPETDEPEYRSRGTSAHSVGYECLTQGKDAWEFAGTEHGKHEADMEIMTAVQLYVDECRQIVNSNPGAEVFYEFNIANPEFHPDFFGTLDFGAVEGTTMYIRDYKHGAGIAVDCEWNPQIMYYAWGLLHRFPSVETVDLAIVQPRAFHPQGPIRRWSISAGALHRWALDELRPAMARTATDDTFDAGPWCRFCPAKLVCPLMVSLFGAACKADPKLVVKLDTQSLGRSYQYTAAVKSYLKALEEETLRRLMAGEEVPGTKLVNKKANRIFKEGASYAIDDKLGEDAWTQPELKSPAELEKLGPDVKKLVAEWAYTPVTGLTVALASDKRVAQKVESGSTAFKQYTGE